MAQPEDVLGRDLAASYRVTDGRHEDVDLRTREQRARGELQTDLDPVEGTANAVQAVIDRLKTRRGELADLGHPEYGSRHHDLIGEPNSEHNRNLVKLYVLQALAHEPRLDKVLRATVAGGRGPAADLVEIRLEIAFIGASAPENLVIPFSFEGPA